MKNQKTPHGSTKTARYIASGLSAFVNGIADAGFEMFNRRGQEKDEQADKINELKAECHELLSTLGEATGTALARKVLQSYLALDHPEKSNFFQMLRDEFHIDKSALKEVAAAFVETGGDAELSKLLAQSEPARQELFRRLNMAPDGTKTLIEMRGSMLPLLRENPELKPVDDDFCHLFSSWFNRGFLELKSIDWLSPAIVLEKLIENESVHEMRGWDDLRRRLASDRRCFAFFHSALPNEPLVFVEVALVTGLATEIGPIINSDALDTVFQDFDTAIFYSINNCLNGLVGISFGNFLIKQVVIELLREFPDIKIFSTLSPMPGFRKWMESSQIEANESVLLTEDEWGILKHISNDSWVEDADLVTQLQPILTKCAAQYLLLAKQDVFPVDSVARFHLRNGATLERINWMADNSVERIRESYGFMVNYVYEAEAIVNNHENYVHGGKVAASQLVVALAGPKRAG